MAFDGIDTTVQPFYIAPAMLPVWAARVRPHLVKMGDQSCGRFDVSDLLTFIAAGKMQLWIAVRGADLLCVMLTEIHTYPKLRAMRIIALSGHRPLLWRKLLRRVEIAAKERFGCRMMEALPRASQLALLPGYEVSHVLVEKVID
jgi:hypothetical protein